MSYDAEHQLSSEIAPGDATKTTFTYDPVGNVLSETDGTGTLTSSYDESGRVTQTTDSYGAQASFTFDADGLLLQRIAATGPLVSSAHYVTQYNYDADGEPTSLTDPAGRSYEFLYDNLGNLKATQYPNGTFSWSDTNPDGWLTGLYNRHGSLGASLPASAPADASPIADYAYQYNQNGQRTQETLSASGQADQVTGYSYDGMGRLDQVSLSDGTCRHYSYDADSNRTEIQDAPTGCGGTFSTTSTYTYNPSITPGVDQLTSVTDANGTTSFAYTGDGQVKSYGSNTLTWDGWGRVSGGTFNGDAVTYHYDASGDLKSRTSSSGADTRYLLGDLFETDGSGQITTSYVDGPDGDLAEYSGPPTPASPVSFLYYNGHGDLAAEADSGGNRTALHTYDPFGAPLDTPPADSTSHRYTGEWNKQYDSASGLILMGARPYDPSLGRFLAVDPVDGGSLNNYDYAAQDPINSYDLNGLAVSKKKKTVKKKSEEQHKSTERSVVIKITSTAAGAVAKAGAGAAAGAKIVRDPFPTPPFTSVATVTSRLAPAAGGALSGAVGQAVGDALSGHHYSASARVGRAALAGAAGAVGATTGVLVGTACEASTIGLGTPACVAAGVVTGIAVNAGTRYLLSPLSKALGWGGL